ncbi:MAG: radical SAM family heme chaperone HemW [Provencibacterium sp.]|jgi:oxygen-independent coproporphyrinogen-3 oxidase|nr:radical SAM family heme chaperone HemW [Provencibacterium sp.]
MPEPTGLYLHIPFCRQKCGYCDFYSLPASEQVRAAYVKRLCEMLACPPFGSRLFSTVYFGGGTPSLLSSRQIRQLLEAVQHFHTLSPDAEITLECNPGAVSAAFFKEVAAVGVNRISLGLQSADPEQLRFLGRTHSPQEVRQAAIWAQKAGIENLSLDVMLALPGQTKAQLLKTLRFVYACGAQHLSAYLLKIEPDTPFERRGMAALCPDADETADLYLAAVSDLAAHGYRQYEVSNFCLPGRESRHNLGYWLGTPYLGIGPAAHSFLRPHPAARGERFFFPRSLEGFLQAEDPWSLLQPDGEGGGAQEFFMLRLRLDEGLDLMEAERRYAIDRKGCLAAAAPLERAGLLKTEGSRLRLTPQGFLVSNAVILQLLEAAGIEDPL